MFDAVKLNIMSANKRAGDNSSHSGPSKIQRNQVNSSSFIQQALSMSTTMTTNDGNGLGPVEVMETPFKSENDKKSYRVIRLSNGLTALLISDPTQARESNEQGNEADVNQHTAATSGDEEEEDDSDAGDESSDEENSDDEHGTANKQQKRGKLAACSLCVDVGSFSDPRDVQGLAHFLGEIEYTRLFSYFISD